MNIKQVLLATLIVASGTHVLTADQPESWRDRASKAWQSYKPSNWQLPNMYNSWNDWRNRPRRDYVEEQLPAMPSEPQYPTSPVYPQNEEIHRFKQILRSDKYGAPSVYPPSYLPPRLPGTMYPFGLITMYSRDTTPNPQKIADIRKNIQYLSDDGSMKKKWKQYFSPTVQEASAKKPYLSYDRYRKAAKVRKDLLQPHEADVRAYIQEYNRLNRKYEKSKQQVEAQRAFLRDYARQKEESFNAPFINPYE